MVFSIDGEEDGKFKAVEQLFRDANSVATREFAESVLYQAMSDGHLLPLDALLLRHDYPALKK